MTIFVDTSAVFSSLDANDEFHAKAFGAWERLVDTLETLLTSNYVVLESTWLAQRRLGLDTVRRFYSLVVPILSIQWVSEELHRVAASTLLSSSRRNISLVDYTSFELMRRQGIQEVFTFDRHFKDQGFKCLP